MSYPLSATKLQTYQHCPQQYYYRHELKLRQPAFFSAASLGTALHQALAKFYWEWHYQDPIPPIAWLHQCWQQVCISLTPTQLQEGRGILERYYQQFVIPQGSLRKPLAVEGRIQASLQVENLEFALTGQYDRIDWLDDGLELIDYKSGKDLQPPQPDAMDVQLGLYYLALEQRYSQSLKWVSLIHLRTGEKFSFAATPSHKARVLEMIRELALQLRFDDRWQPRIGDHCQQCGYQRYCPAVQEEPEALPVDGRSQQQLQLVLSL